MARNNEQPTLTIRGNLQWTTSGQVTATYLITPMDYGLRGVQDKLDVKNAHKILGQELPEGSRLFSYQAPMDLRTVLERMVGSVDLDSHEDYARELVAAYNRLARIAPTTRLMGFTIPVGRWSATTGTVSNWLDNDKLAQQHPTPTDQQLAEYRATAAEVLTRLGGAFLPTPVKPAFFQWVWEHNLFRGISPQPAPAGDAASTSWKPSKAAFKGAALDEGGQTDFEGRRVAVRRPLLKVIHEDPDLPASYQSMITIGSFPYSGAVFPGGTEFYSCIEGTTATTVDWVSTIKRRSADEVNLKNVRTLRRIGDQIEQTDADLNFNEDSNAAKVSLLRENNAYFEQNPGESEIAFTTVFAVGSTTPEATAAAVSAIKRKFKTMKMELNTPLGHQKSLWSLFNIGSPHRAEHDAFSHITPTDMWAGFVPFITGALGDGKGPVIAINLLSGQCDPIHFDLMEATKLDISACFSLVGELGSGKSYFLKTLLGLVYDAGGQFLAIDRSPSREYEKFAAAIPGANVLDLTNPNFGLDPLRMFTLDITDDDEARRAVDYSTDIILPLLNIQATSTLGNLLRNLLRIDIRRENDIYSMKQLIRVVDERSRAGGPDAPLYAELLAGLLSWQDMAQVLFDENLPVLRFDHRNSRANIMLTHGVSLPEPEEFYEEHLFRRLSPRKLLGMASYELIGICARQAFLDSRTPFGLLGGDEAHHWTLTPVGKQIANEFARDGRKNDAAMGLASHDSAADYKGVALDLVSTRFVFRHRNEKLARNALEWIGIDPDANPHLVKQLREKTSPLATRVDDATGQRIQEVPMHRRGEFFMSDSEGRIGRGKVLGPALGERAAAINTTPGELAARR